MSSSRAARRSVLLFASSVVLAASAAGCGGGSSVLDRPAQNEIAYLPAATASACIAPATQAATVNIPSAGGVTVSLQLEAASAASSCVAATVATGADATSASRAISAARSHRLDASPSAAPLPAPLMSVSLTDTNVVNFNVAGVTFAIAPPAVIPNGSYPATVTTTYDLGDGQVSNAVSNYTMVVANGTATIVGPFSQLGVDTTGVLAIYPRGTALPPQTTPEPLATDSPTPLPSATPIAVASASAAPTATPTASPSGSVTSSPTNPTGVVGSITLSPPGCTDVTEGSTTTISAAANTNARSVGTTIYYGWPIALLNGWTITIPSPLYTYIDNNHNVFFTITASSTVTVTAPTYGTSGQLGSGQIVKGALFTDDGGTYFPVYQSGGQMAQDMITLTTGLTSCT